MEQERVRWLRAANGKRAHAFAFGRHGATGETIVSQCSRWFELEHIEFDESDAVRCGTCRFVLESWRATESRVGS
jgi:ferredoxin-like protein FixX